jgi:hypothetical protein
MKNETDAERCATRQTEGSNPVAWPLQVLIFRSISSASLGREIYCKRRRDEDLPAGIQISEFCPVKSGRQDLNPHRAF